MSEAANLLTVLREGVAKAVSICDPQLTIFRDAAAVTEPAAPAAPKSVRPGSLADPNANRRLIRAQHKNAL